MSISGNLVGTYTSLGKTFVFVDEDGNELTGVCVDNPVVFTAGDNDVREGFTYASDNGASTGTKKIPAYHTTEGVAVIPAGSTFSISLPGNNSYDYTKLQAIICSFNSSMTNSVFSEKVSIDDKVYAVSSTEALSTVTADHENKSINFGIVNNSGTLRILRYFTYREEY